MKFVRVAVAAAFLACAVSMVSAQTGGITVKVVDANGDPLPGATVTISHPMGYVKEDASQTNKNGVAEFPVLRATGQSTVGYTINVTFPGFAPTTVPDVKVSIGDNAKVPVQLAEEIVEHVTSVATTDVVDLETTAQSTTYSDQFIGDLPVPGRFYQNVLTLSPGVQDADGDGNPNVNGSRDRDFKTTVSGVSNVDPLTGQQMSQVNPNSIEEMEVITAGAGVEFSRAQGGFARILQKQGSNEFEGVVEMYYRSSVLDGDGAGDFNNVTDPNFDWLQPSVQVSGPIVKDKLWYRLSHEWIYRDLPTNTTTGIATVTDNQQIHSDQLTWQASPRNKLSLEFNADPHQIENFGVSSTRPAESALSIDNESQGYFLTWTAPYSPKILVESQVAWQDFNVTVAPTQTGTQNDCLANGPSFIANATCFNLTTGLVSGSANQDINDHRQRLTVHGDATVYGGRYLGANHTFKIGMSVENERYARQLYRRPFVNFYVVSATDNTESQDKPEQTAVVFGNFSAPEFTQVTAKGLTWGAYAEDQIKPAQNLTLTLGLRVDREEINSDGWSPLDPEAESGRFLSAVANGASGTQASQRTFTAYEDVPGFFHQLANTFDVPYDDLWQSQAVIVQQSAFWWNSRTRENINVVNTNPAPRISISWDPWSNGKTKFAATAGRYYNNIALNIPLIELQPANTNIAFNANPSGSGWAYAGPRSSISAAVNVQAVDRQLDTPYQDEWTLQFERQIFAETSVRLSYINRAFRNQLQDTDINHVPGDFGVCIPSTTTNPALVVRPVTPSDPNYDAALAPGDGVLDDCMGEIERAKNTGSGENTQNTNDAIFLRLPDGTPDLYVQNPGWGDIFWVGNINSIDYEGYILELIRRQYRSWEMQASYTYSKAFGDGEDFGQSLGDDRSLIQDEKGYQAYDQRHVVKINATTITPWGFRLGGAISWQSGLPYSLLWRNPAFDAVPPAYAGLQPGNPARVRTRYITGQRNDQRNSSYWNVDVRFTKELTIGKNLNMQIAAEVFNLLNDGTYMVYDPLTQTGEQINGNNTAVRRFGRQWQLGLKLAF